MKNSRKVSIIKVNSLILWLKKIVEKEATDAIVRQIRTDLRLSMDGVVAASMRAKGSDYRMNFGVNLPRIKEITSNYTANQMLAEILWKENVRELKIMATLLYPAKNLSRETAEKWCNDISNQEIREQTCMNLFQEVSFADALVNDWIAHENEKIRTTGFWLFARLCIIHSEALGGVSETILMRGAVQDLKSESLLLRQAALNALRYLGRTSPQRATEVLQAVESAVWAHEDSSAGICNLLRFEFGYED